MNRVDTKFIFHIDALPSLLHMAKDAYRILEIDGLRQMSYQNQYFDTAAYQFYKDHHNGKSNRVKVRLRHYVDTQVTFLEVKKKDNKKKTKKTRIKVSAFTPELTAAGHTFLNGILTLNEPLVPSIQNNFKRITLVGPNERVTLDTDLRFLHNTKSMATTQLVIAEIKQAGLDRSSPFFQFLKKQQIQPYRISKYCVGVASLIEDIKYNSFKEKLNRIHKITA